MPKEMVINAVVERAVRVAIVADASLQDLFEETQDSFRTRGNIYQGRVANVQANLEACFVEYGAGSQGFLPMDEILPTYWARAPKGNKKPRIEQVIKPKQSLLVQVETEPGGTKGSRLTTDISLAGRYLVLTPLSDRRGVSRKIDDPEQRSKFKEIANKLSPPKDMGFILRTAVFDQTQRALARDLNYLVRLWKDIQKRARKISQTGLLYSEADIVQRVLRDYYTNDIDQVWIDDPRAMDKAKRFFELFMPRQKRKLKSYTGKVPIFSSMKIESQIDDIHRRRVSLPSGGSLVIDQTEALVAIDVNSGKAKGQRGQEQMATACNLEAATEIARQLRLRNLGGIIVIDFIDMTKASNQRAVEKALRDAMRADKARRQIGKISAFGLCTLTRQRLDRSIRLLGYLECPTCKGDGVIRAADGTAVRLFRKIQTRIAEGSTRAVRVRLHPELSNHVQNKHRGEILAMERDFQVAIEFEGVPGVDRSHEEMEFLARSIPAASNAVEPKKEPGNQSKPEPKPEIKTETKKRRRRRRRKKPKE